MQPVIEFFQRARQRINARIAILAVVGIIGSVAVWQGFAHMAANKPTAPNKQVATGPQAGTVAGEVQPVAATLPDEQMPGAGGVRALGSTYDNVNPYAQPSQADSSSPAASLYNSQSEAAGPANPYRASVGDAAGESGAGAPPTSPYAQSDAQSGAGAAAASAPETTTDDPVEAYRKRFSSGASAAPATSPAAVSEATVPPEATLSDSPYSQPAEATPIASPAETPPSRSLTSGAGSLNPYASSSRLAAPPTTSPLHAAELSAQARSAAATPGERQLEGPQQPSITVEKFSPAEIQVGKPATFELIVRNPGQVPAQNVVVTDHVPAGTQLVDVKPQPSQNSDGSLVWQLGTMQPGDEAAITVQVMPQTEGEIGSTAHVSFAAQATSRSICTRPQLTIEHTAPPKLLIGEALTMGITVSNPGTGPATGVMIEEDVPEGLSHVAGGQLEYEVGTLRPGESKRLELSLKADKPGLIENTIIVRGEGNLTATHKIQIEVVAPQLEVAVSGPKKRFLERQATYTVSLANPGTAAARDVELVAYLPRGMKFIESDSQGQYDPAQHAVFWSLEELPASKAGSVKLTTLPIEPGEQRLRVEGKADLGLAVAGEQIVQVEQSAELLHTVKDADEVIEVGSETTYLIKVSNIGTKAATNVRIVAMMPPEIKATSGEGPTRASGDASRIVFEPLARLNPQEEVTFKVLVQGVAAGDHIVRVQLSSDEWPNAVTREESTRVYEDR